MNIQILNISKSHKWNNLFIDILKKRKRRIIGIMKRVYSLFRKEVWILEATGPNRRNSDSVLFIGNDPNRHYISGLFFDNYTHRLIGRRWLWQALFPMGKTYKNCSFSIIQTSMQIDRFCRSNRRFCVPAWVYGRVDLATDFDFYLRKNKTLKQNLKKVKNGHFGVEISSDPVLFEEFYYKMYHPYISKRHGECAVDMSYKRLKAVFMKHREILFIVKDSQRIAGMIICFMGDRAQAYELGVRDGNFKWVEQGVISALYLNAINYCKTKNIKKLCLGGSRPFLTDGALNYKLKNWNMKLEDYAKESYFCIIQHRESGFARDFLTKNPFISLKKSKMVANSFCVEYDKKNDVANDKVTKYNKYGLRKVAVHSLKL